MKLSEVVSQYVTYKQSIGMRFRTEKRTLKSFCRAMGNDIAIAEVETEQVLAFIAGTLRRSREVTHLCFQEVTHLIGNQETH